MRRPDSDGTNRVHAGDRHVRRGSSEGSVGTQTRVRVHGSEDGRTTVTLECPDQVLDVPVQLRPEVDLVESDSDADVTALEEHETPTKEKLQPGHRDHAPSAR